MVLVGWRGGGGRKGRKQVVQAIRGWWGVRVVVEVRDGGSRAAEGWFRFEGEGGGKVEAEVGW